MSEPPQDAPQTAPRQGTVVDASDPDRLRHALELAFDYRGDVTIKRRSTGESIAGYLYDRTAGASFEASVVRMMPANGADHTTIPYSDILEISFTGRDPAEGKSFDTWMKKYVQKKLAGEEASIQSEPIDGEGV